MSFRAELSGPIDLFDVHRLDPAAYPFLLQSVAGHPVSGRYDILFAFPQQSIVLRDDVDFFAQISAQYAAEKTDQTDLELPFCGGWFVYLGYEAARQVEPTVVMPRSRHRWPDAFAVRCPAAAIFDRERQVIHLFAEQDQDQLLRMKDDVRRCLQQQPQSCEEHLIESVEADRDQDFLLGTKKVLQYLAAGDNFQVNLSRRWLARLASGASYQSVYSRLRQRNPAPFAGLACWQGGAVLSSSPERLVRVLGDIVETRPIAGTRPRGSGEDEDRNQQRRLIDSLKERAEHVMLIDLERNDLGRICEPGSIVVNELMIIESYAHVHHIVSNVRGKLRPGTNPADVLRAVFPGGTITGCPKVRAMEIIAELEGIGRGPYTGSMGYLSRCGRMDTNILIRSLLCEDGFVSFRAGAGIVADSDPDAELAETNAKARGLLLALGAKV